MARPRNVSILEFDATTKALQFRTAVSTHAHTHHSREVIADIPPYVLKIPVLAGIFTRELERYAARTGGMIDFSAGWWHPPVTPREVFDAETKQIEEALGA